MNASLMSATIAHPHRVETDTQTDNSEGYYPRYSPLGVNYNREINKLGTDINRHIRSAMPATPDIQHIVSTQNKYKKC